MRRPAERVVAFYNKRGTCEQWIKEGKGAIKWTRLSCRTFAANAVRLQLHALALQPRQFPARAGDAGADQGLVADESEGQADQDRREGGEPRPLCYLPDGRGRHPTANVPGDFAAHRGATAAATTSASVRRFRCHAFKSNRQKECVQMPGKMARSDSQTPLGQSGMSGAIHPLASGLPASSENAYHPRSGFWGIPVMKTHGHARGARRVEGTGITGLRPLADSLDTYARQIHSIAEIIRVIEEESAEQSTEAKAAENTAPCSPHAEFSSIAHNLSGIHSIARASAAFR